MCQFAPRHVQPKGSLSSKLVQGILCFAAFVWCSLKLACRDDLEPAFELLRVHSGFSGVSFNWKVTCTISQRSAH